jgi:hypothetical protein
MDSLRGHPLLQPLFLSLPFVLVVAILTVVLILSLISTTI